MQEHQKGDLRFVSVFFKGQITSHLISRVLPLTARQYGEVVLPDAASDREIVPVGQKAVTVQGGYGALFAVRVQILLSITSVGVQC